MFRYYSPVLDQEVAETLWATKVDETNGVFRLDNIPFYGFEIATQDEFTAIFDSNEGMYLFERLVQYSGNSVVLVVVFNSNIDKTEELREQFLKSGCSSEKLHDGYFALEILEAIDYSNIKSILDELENNGTIEYSEPCLSAKHNNDLMN